MTSALRNVQIMLVALFMFANVVLAAEIVADPIKDFLNLDIQDRYTEVSEVTKITEFAVDINGDGNMELFIGHPQLWQGDNTGLYCAVYSKADERFIRLTPAESDIRIDQRFFGDPATTFVGYINEVSREGVLVLTNEFFQEDLLKFDSAKVYSTAGDKIAITDLGAIDRTTKQGQEFYDRYFGKGVESRSIEMHEFSSTQLQERGYQLPSWKPKNIDAAAPTDAVLMSPSPQIAVTPDTTRTPAPTAATQSTTSPTPATVETKSTPWPWIVGAILFLAVAGGIFLELRRK